MIACNCDLFAFIVGRLPIAKPHTMNVLLLNSPFMSVDNYFMYIGAPVFGAYMFTKVMSS